VATELRHADKPCVGRSLICGSYYLPRRRWEDGIRMDLREIGLGGVDWIGFDCLRTGTGGGLL
jgi:hypothetical protein